MINTYILELVNYGIRSGLIEESDRIYTTNRLAELLGIDEYITPAASPETRELHLILEDMMNWAYEHGVMKSDTNASKDLFDTKLMGALTPPPSVVIKKFDELRAVSAKEATDWYYAFSKATNYIRTDRIVKDVKWLSPTEFGDIDITLISASPRRIREISQRQEKRRARHTPSVFSVPRTKATPARSRIPRDRTTG